MLLTHNAVPSGTTSSSFSDMRSDRISYSDKSHGSDPSCNMARADARTSLTRVHTTPVKGKCLRARARTSAVCVQSHSAQR